MQILSTKAFTVKTEAEKIFTNLMGTGASRLPTDPNATTRADFHGIVTAIYSRSK